MPMNPKAYLETSIVSYLTGWPSRDLVRAAQQQVTRDWWAPRGSFGRASGFEPPIICTPLELPKE